VYKRQTYTWNRQRHESETFLEVLHYGKEPLFVFHPTDVSNRPIESDRMWIWWGIYPEFIRTLFTQAFTAGLEDPSPHVRIPKARWHIALLRLRDSANSCPACSAAVFYDPAAPGASCWRCHTPLPNPIALKVRGATLVLAPDAELTNHHLLHDRDFRGLAGIVEPHPDKPGAVTLRNLTDYVWSVCPDGQEPKLVKPNQRLAVRPMDIDFGPTTGRIEVCTTKAARSRNPRGR